MHGCDFRLGLQLFFISFRYDSRMYRRMPSRWEESNLRKAVESASSIRGVIHNLGLIPAGGNYSQCYFYINKYSIDTSHFRGQAWCKGLSVPRKPLYALEELLVRGRRTARTNLKRRLYDAGLKEPKCEECGWCEKGANGRIPVELDHINGDNMDNRLENLRILCPNCHSLKSTHRGSNIGRGRRGGEIG